jgi:hypothetical protein
MKSYFRAKKFGQVDQERGQQDESQIRMHCHLAGIRRRNAHVVALSFPAIDGQISKHDSMGWLPDPQILSI